MFAWRITKANRADDLSGKGAAVDGGRWNNAEVPAVYMGLTPAICSLETFVHTSHYPKLPLKITQFVLPDDKQLYLELSSNDLPAGWDAIPADKPSMIFGTKWLYANSHLGLIVPSAVLPLERNIMLNPNHPDIKWVKIKAQYNFMYDKRMYVAPLFS